MNMPSMYFPHLLQPWPVPSLPLAPVEAREKGGRHAASLVAIECWEPACVVHRIQTNTAMFGNWYVYVYKTIL